MNNAKTTPKPPAFNCFLTNGSILQVYKLI